MNYGENCNTPCSDININCQACDRNGKCLKCKNNILYGDSCENSCDKCPGEICEIDGTCTNEGNCKDNEYYGTNCQLPCSNISPFCTKCSREGKCFESSDNYHYGDNCDQTCDNCPNKKCYINGVCLNQVLICNDKKHFGPSCDTECDIKCDECNREGQCTSCKDNLNWDILCDKSCEIALIKHAILIMVNA